MKSQIGWAVLKEDSIYYNEFETAAWYEKVMVKAGRYPVEVYDMRFDGNGKMQSHIDGAYVNMEGTIISDNFQSLFYGTPIGDAYDTQKNAGKPSRHSDFLYLYSVANHVLGGRRFEYDIELFPEYEAREIRFISHFDGEEKVTHGIFRK